MLDVIDEQLLMLHLVLETETNNPQNFFRVVAMGKLLDESRHLLVDVRAILASLSDSRSRTRTALWPLDPGAEAFVVIVAVAREHANQGPATTVPMHSRVPK